MNSVVKGALALAVAAIAAQAAAQVTFYEHDGFQGQSFTTQEQVANFQRHGFNDRASSVVVRGNQWEVCEDAQFRGRCVVLRPGQYPSLGAMGLNDRVSSVRVVDSNARFDAQRYAPAPAGALVTFYEGEGFEGRSFATENQVENFTRYGFNDRASSVVVVGAPWEVCQDAQFGGRCAVLRPGRYASLAAMGLDDRVSSVRVVDSNAHFDAQRSAPVPPAAQITFYEGEGFEGRSFAAENQVENFTRYGFNDRASSVVVVGAPWEVCQDAQFNGRCVVLRPGNYTSLAAMGLNDRISSARTVSANTRGDDSHNGYAPAPVAVYDGRRRDNEQLYEANITSVRAVVGTPEQRCWVEREQIAQTRGDANVPAAIAGALIGGILGHQVGGGSGKDLATVGGVVAGAAIGANVGRDGGGQPASTQNVQRCTSVPSQSRPDYWDVTYTFRGQEHRVQMTTPPGATVTVNWLGEPRA